MTSSSMWVTPCVTCKHYGYHGCTATSAEQCPYGLIAKKEDETARINGYSDEMLNVLIEDARKVAAQLVAAKPTGPKAHYGQTETDTFTKAVEDQREALYGYRRDAAGKVMR